MGAGTGQRARAAQSEASAGSGVSLVLASGLFFLSGALGLGYQLVWIEKASLLVGSSQAALSTVLTSFFLGLALGSLCVGRLFRSRRRSPLFVYGLFEVAIGLFALAFPALFVAVGHAYGALYPAIQESAVGLAFVRFLLLFALFLVPTFFMGGTLPLLLDGLVERDASVGPLTSRLYGINILGAVVGVLATGYLLIPSVGMNGTSLLAGFGNLAVGGVALAAFRSARPLHARQEGWGRGPAGFYSALAFASGLAAIAYQVLWARYFGLFQTSSVYFFALLIGVYLLALAFGSLMSGALLRRGVRALRALALLQPAVPVLVVACLGGWQVAAHSFFPGDHYDYRVSWSLVSETVDAILVAPGLQIALVVFLPVALLGSGLPLVIAAATRTHDALRGHSGTLVFWNTVGSSAGGVVTGYLLIPTLGLGGSLLAVGVVSVAIGLASEWRLSAEADGTGLRRRLLRPGYALGLLCFAVFVSGVPTDLAARVIDRWGWGREVEETAQLVEWFEGPLTTAWVYRESDNTRIGSGAVALAQAWHEAASPQMVQGHIPVLFHPKPGIPERALGIAVGSGQAFGALLHYPIEQLDVVDISSEMLELSFRHFAPYNNELGKDPRARIFLDDGRHFVARAPDDYYDIVTTEPPPPSDDGVYALYSLEFYREVARVLRDGGVFLQWLPLYMVTPDDLRGMLRTQHEAFPNTLVFRSANRDFAIVSFQGERPVFRRAWIEERVRYFARERRVAGTRWARTCRFELAEPESVMAMLLTGSEDVAAVEAELHHDDEQRLSYSSGDRELLRRYGARVADLSFAALPLTPFAELQEYFDTPLDVPLLEEQRACSLKPFGVASPALLARKAARYDAATAPEERSRIALEIAALHARSSALDPALGWVERALVIHPTESRAPQVEIARRIGREHAVVFGEPLRAWLEGLDDGVRFSLVVAAIEEEVAAAERRTAGRRARYWLSWR